MSNSINHQQKEKNHEDLHDKDALKKIKELVKKTNTCFFCTTMSDGKPFKTRPMTVQDVDEEGNLWFLSASDSGVNAQASKDHQVQLFFQGSAHSDFLVLNGKASISRDKQKIEEFWEPLLKTWFTEGKDDPRITVIKVENEGGYYWDTKHGNAIAFAKMAVGAMIGETMDDSIEGHLKV